MSRLHPAQHAHADTQCSTFAREYACYQLCRYYAFVDAGCTVTLYSVEGGKITIDAGSLSDTFKTENDKRFETSGDVAKLDTSAAMASIKADR